VFRGILNAKTLPDGVALYDETNNLLKERHFPIFAFKILSTIASTLKETPISQNLLLL
jgi:hypothetical protein